MDSIIVIHISIDGLTPHTIDELGENKLPTIYKLQENGVFTHNARTDPNYTITLPNHSTMFTGRGVRSIDINGVTKPGHYITFNSNSDDNIHNINSEYVYSVFDIVKNNGYRAGMFVGKSKFEFLNHSYDNDTGKLMIPDGIDEIDEFFMSSEFKLIGNNKVNTFNGSVKMHSSDKEIPIVTKFLSTFNSASICNYNFIHFRGTDSIGHMYGWNSTEYKEALRGIDYDLNIIINTLEESSKICYVILTSDHGGGGGGSNSRNHHDQTYAINFTIPFYVWRNDNVMRHMNHDIYYHNPQRTEPKKDENPDYDENSIPIRNGDVANLVLKLLNLPKVTNSWINEDQDLFIPA